MGNERTRDMSAPSRPAKPFKVVFELHIDGRRVRMVRSFANAEAAQEYAALCNPDDEPKIYPNVLDESWKAFETQGFEYWSGVRWFGNMPAVIMHWYPYA